VVLGDTYTGSQPLEDGKKLYHDSVNNWFKKHLIEFGELRRATSKIGEKMLRFKKSK